MEKKEKIKININNGMKRLLKKLDINIKLSQLRDLLKKDIKEEFCFIEKDEKENYSIPQEDEKDFVLKDILDQKNNTIYISITINKIIILLKEEKFDEINCSDDINLNDLRQLSKKMNDNFIFIDKEEYEITQEQEKDFQAKEIISDGYIKIKQINIENKIIENKENNENDENNKNDDNNKINKNNDKNENISKNLERKQERIIKEKQKERKESNELYQKENKKEISIDKNDKINEYLKKIEDLSLFFKNIIISPEIAIPEINDEYFLFKKKYEQFKGIKRFAIPVFGIISSGKSTFLNYILNLDELLEIKEDISTQFICIIRNKKNLKKPKLYSIKLVLRDKDNNFVNFIKDHEIEGDIKSIIKKKNLEVKESKAERNPEDYFLLIETEIPFLSENEYSDLFEFMDFPGLNESYSNNQNKINLFYKDYMPLILPNIKFPIFIFQIGRYEGIETTKIINYYKNFSEIFKIPLLKDIEKNSFNEAIYILNKSDLLDTEEEKEEQLKIFREKFEISQNNSFLYSSKEKLLENNKFNSFYQFTEYIINDKNPISNEFIEQLEDKLEKELNIKQVKNLLDNSKKEELLDQEELEKFNELVKDSIFNFEGFEKEKYLKYKNVFLNNIPKNKSFKSDDLTNFLKNKMKNIYDDFTNLNEFKISLKTIEEKENKESYNRTVQNIEDELFKNNLRIFNPNQLNQIENKIDKCLDDFLSINKNSNIFKRIKKENKDFNDFLISNEISFKILLLGKYSSGKSSLLNSIIGYDLNILDVKENECTKNAFIIKYCKSIDNISLNKCELKQNNYGFFYFDEEEEIVKGLENVKKKIKELNENSNDKILEYYIVKTPIEIFDELNLSEKIKNYILLIDLPGLDVSGYRELIFFGEKMIKFLDGLIYVNHGCVIEDEENSKSIMNCINQIVENKTYFSFKSVFFISTFADKYKAKIEDFKKNVLNLIDFTSKKENFINILKQDDVIKEKEEIIFSKFSNTYYGEYQKLKHFNLKSKNIKDFYDELKNCYFSFKDKELDEYNPNEERYKKIKIRIKDHFNIQETNALIPIVSKLYLFILDNIERYKKYKLSNAKQFFIDIKRFILNVEENYYRALTDKFKHFFKERVYVQLINLKFYSKKKNPKKLSPKEAKKKILNIQKYEKECLETNEYIFDKYSKIFDEKITQLKTFCGKKEFEKQKEIFDGFMMNINEILKKEINAMIIEFNCKCYFEVQIIQNELFGESYLKLDKSIDLNIKIREILKKGGVITSGIFGGIGIGVGIYGVIAGGIANPIAGIVIGSIYLLVASGASIYRLIKGKKKVNEEYVDEHKLNIEKIIIDSKNEVIGSINKTCLNYITKIEELIDLQKEDIALIRKNMPIYEKNLEDLYEYIKSTKNIVFK